MKKALKIAQIIIFSFIIFGCAYNIESYPIIDRDYNTHSYDEFININYNNYNKTLYCQKHYKWEQVKVISTNQGIKYIIKGDK